MEEEKVYQYPGLFYGSFLGWLEDGRMVRGCLSRNKAAPSQKSPSANDNDNILLYDIIKVCGKSNDLYSGPKFNLGYRGAALLSSY